VASANSIVPISFNVSSPANGTFYVSVLSNTTKILSQLDFSHLSAPLLPTGFSVTYDLVAGGNINVSQTGFFTVRDSKAIEGTATLTLNNVAPGTYSFQIVVFQVGVGNPGSGTSAQFNLQVNS
jgi:hypothetical protein